MTLELISPTCANHPQTPTALRCNRCDKLICSKCAIRTPTGYRCRECVLGQQKSFDTAQWYDYPLAFLLAGGLSFVGGLAATSVGFFVIFAGPLAGMIIAESVRLIVRKRRSKYLFRATAIAAALGSLIPILTFAFGLLILLSQGRSVSLIHLLPLLWQGLYAFAVTSTVYYRLAGIQI